MIRVVLPAHLKVLANVTQEVHLEVEGVATSDAVIDELARVLELLDPTLQIVLLTGRPMRVQPQTLAWLERYGLRWDLLVMRARGDYSQVTWYKRDTVDELRHFGFDLRLAFEDDPNNFAMFHAMGIPCVYIHSGYYE